MFQILLVSLCNIESNYLCRFSRVYLIIFELINVHYLFLSRNLRSLVSIASSSRQSRTATSSLPPYGFPFAQGTVVQSGHLLQIIFDPGVSLLHYCIGHDYKGGCWRLLSLTSPFLFHSQLLMKKPLSLSLSPVSCYTTSLLVGALDIKSLQSGE